MPDPFPILLARHFLGGRFRSIRLGLIASTGAVERAVEYVDDVIPFRRRQLRGGDEVGNVVADVTTEAEARYDRRFAVAHVDPRTFRPAKQPCLAVAGAAAQHLRAADDDAVAAGDR